MDITTNRNHYSVTGKGLGMFEVDFTPPNDFV